MMDLIKTYSYDDVTLIPQFSDLKSRSEANPQMKGYKLPIIASCMDTLGRNLMLDVISKNIPFIAHRAFKSAEEQFKEFIPDINSVNDFYANIWFAVGSVQKYRTWIDYLFEQGVRHFCVDMAHGDSQCCIDTIKYIKERAKEYNKIISKLNQSLHIIAGNVATVEGFKRLQRVGAQGVRVGIASRQYMQHGEKYSDLEYQFLIILSILLK